MKTRRELKHEKYLTLIETGLNARKKKKRYSILKKLGIFAFGF